MLENILLFDENLRSRGDGWAITLVFWLGTFLFTYFIFSVTVLKHPYTFSFMIGVFLLTILCYYIIVFGFKKSVLIGVLSSLFVILLYLYFTYYCFYYISQLDNADFFSNAINSIGNLRFWQLVINSKLFYLTYTLSLFNIVPPLAIKTTYELLKKFYKVQKLKEENLKLEMNYLHSQINPHFLLNTLTAIYNMVIDQPRASQSIETLAGLLQYSLYDTETEKVLLEKEITFIENYIKLSRIRLNTNKELKFTLSGDQPQNQTIVPLILVNLVENGIKHGLHRVSGAAKTEITLNLDGNMLQLTTYNRLPEVDFLSSQGGVGLENTRRRLEIYYQGKHSFKTETKDGFFKVNLVIEL